MADNIYSVTNRVEATVSANSVLRKTYLLLSCTLLFSGLTASWAMATNARFLGPIISIVGMFGLMFLTQALRKSRWGIVACFAFTGFMGYVLGPTLNFYIHAYSNGGQLILTALGGTGVIFFVLTAYTLITRKDFSYLGGFLFVAILGVFLASLATFFFHMPILQLLISAAFMLLCSALIMFYTSAIIHGGESNYIMATIALYVALLNIFISLLNILMIFSGNRN